MLIIIIEAYSNVERRVKLNNRTSFYPKILIAFADKIVDNVKQECIWWVNLVNFCKKYLENLKHNLKRAFNFHLILVAIPFSLIYFVKNRGMGRVLTDKIC